MQKMIRPVLLGAALLLGAGVAQAEAIKVGVVDLTKVMEKAPQADAARKQLEREFAPRERELVGMQKELQKLEEKLGRDGAVMGEAEQRDLERDVRGKKRDLTRLQRESREDFNIRRNEELRKLQKLAFDTIGELAKEEGYDLILSEGVIFHSERVDLTEKMLQRLKDRFKAAPRR